MQFHVLSFEGPDGYARAGGIASRIVGLTTALAEQGHDTHLWFVGDPELPGHERRNDLHLHRWCQWISRFHKNGVYDGEDGKAWDYARSLPPFLLEQFATNEPITVLAEEWHTADAVIHLDALLKAAGRRSQVTILWNANNVFGFERIDWRRLGEAAVITTVSRYMKHVMKPLGVDAVVVPNGLEAEAFGAADAGARLALRRLMDGRPLFAKVARWDPDKRWLAAIDIIAELKREGRRPLLLARGGMEAHGAEVFALASRHGLVIGDRRMEKRGADGLLEALEDTHGLDIVNLRSPLDQDARKLLFAEADCVLANSGHEPFGLVGLEAMAAGGLACTGCSGEDYAIPGRNALVVQTANPKEFIGHFARLSKAVAQSIRDAGRGTAASYAWPEIINRNLLPEIDVARAMQPPFIQMAV